MLTYVPYFPHEFHRFTLPNTAFPTLKSQISWEAQGIFLIWFIIQLIPCPPLFRNFSSNPSASLTADHIALGIFPNAIPILCQKFPNSTQIFLSPVKT